MTVLNDNGIGRVYNVIKQIKEAGYNINPYEAFEKIYSLQKQDIIGAFQAYTDTLKILNNELDRLNTLEIKNKEKYELVIKDIIVGFLKIDMSSDIGLSNFRKHFDDNMMVRIETCSDIISNISNEKSIADEALDSLRLEVEDLINNLLEMDIELEFKKVCLENLERVRHSIINYRLTGNEALAESVERGLGSFIRNRDKINNENSKGIFVKCLNFINNINKLLTVGNQSITLIDTISDNIKSIS